MNGRRQVQALAAKLSAETLLRGLRQKRFHLFLVAGCLGISPSPNDRIMADVIAQASEIEALLRREQWRVVPGGRP